MLKHEQSILIDAPTTNFMVKTLTQMGDAQRRETLLCNRNILLFRRTVPSKLGSPAHQHHFLYGKMEQMMYLWHITNKLCQFFCVQVKCGRFCNNISPASVGNRPNNVLSNVVLPQPFAPSKQTT